MRASPQGDGAYKTRANAMLFEYGTLHMFHEESRNLSVATFLVPNTLGLGALRCNLPIKTPERMLAGEVEQMPIRQFHSATQGP